MKLILASQSPRRKELLGLLGLAFEIKVPCADETMLPGADPAQQVAEVSRRKALATQAEKEDVIIAADTIVVCDGQILGKPRDREDACRMLKMLSGRAHQVMTGLTVRQGDKMESCTEITQVYFRRLSNREIEDYVASGEPMDKAGAYGCQGRASLFVEKLEGDFFNVMGLPLCRLGLMLKELGVELL